MRRGLFLGLLLTLVWGGGAVMAQDPPPPPPTRADSTRMRIFEQIQDLAKAPGVDSTWFVPDSLLSDSALADREARLTGRRATLPRRGSSEDGDSVLAVLLELEGYAVTEYQSQGADFGAKTKELILAGTPDSPARVVREGEEVTSDSALVYSDETGKVYSEGSAAVYQPSEGDPVNSGRIVFDLSEARGTASNAITRYNMEGSDWTFYGDQLIVEENSVFGNGVWFTSCQEEDPHYRFASDNIKIVHGNIMVARPVRVYFADVPVFWLPFMASSTETERASGILTPTFSINDIVRTSRGYSRRLSNIGFYWAASDYVDAMVAMDWWSGQHTSLTGTMNFNWNRQFLSGRGSFRRFWEESGSSNLAYDASGNWQPDERTSLRFRARYASSNSLVRRTSFDPREVVQSIDSEGGLSRRFSFGNLSLSGNRRQYLSDDRVEMTLPTASFSLSPITFLKASPSQARFYNNVTWSGSAKYTRSTSMRSRDPFEPFDFSKLDNMRTNAGLNSSLSLGRLSVSGGVTLAENINQNLPVDYDTVTYENDGYEDLGVADMTWNASINYQQKLVGSTTLTPSLQVSGRLLQADTSSLDQGFVSAPSRMSFGATLKSDLYGFFPGFGNFDAIRHKITPSFDFKYSPSVSPTAFQSEYFANTPEIRRQRTLRISLNQTFEARLKDEAAAERANALDSVRADSLNLVADSLRIYLRQSGATAGDTLTIMVDSLLAEIDSILTDTTQGPTTAQEAQKVTLLGLRTTAMNYDFEEAAEDGTWLAGFTTTRLTNNITSDYLRGLNFSVTHDLFEDQAATAGSGEGEGSGPSRSFAPHLSRMNLGFSLSSQSWVFRTLGSLLTREEEATEEAAAAQVTTGEGGAGEGAVEEDPFAGGLGEASAMPGESRGGRVGRGGGGNVGEWRANLSYALVRPRQETQVTTQMISSTLSFSPTEKWDVSWRTSYNLEDQSFNDHLIRLTRDLHRWEAYFDFTQTATGNWSFRFEVALTDQSDLHFDYHQRSIQEAGGGRSIY